MADATLENEARKVQRIELSSQYMDSNPLYCLFCGQRVLDLSQSVDAGSPYVNPCCHTLYIATDEGFEYCSSRAQAGFGISGDGELDYDEETYDDPLDEGWDGLTDRVPFTGEVRGRTAEERRTERAIKARPRVQGHRQTVRAGAHSAQGRRTSTTSTRTFPALQHAGTTSTSIAPAAAGEPAVRS